MPRGVEIRYDLLNGRTQGGIAQRLPAGSENRFGAGRGVKGGGEQLWDRAGHTLPSSYKMDR